MCQFEATVNHEVRTALNAIMGFAQILHLRSNTTEEVKSYSGIICQQSENLLEIFNEMQRTIGIDVHDALLSGLNQGNSEKI
jgi:signal transduction histidine kinase